MGGALVGLIALQFYWVSNALKLQELHFNQNVRHAMEDVIDLLEKQRTANFLTGRIRQIYHPRQLTKSHLSTSLRIHSFQKARDTAHINQSFQTFIIGSDAGGTIHTESHFIVNGKEIKDSGESNRIVLRNFFDSSLHSESKNRILKEIMQDLNVEIDVSMQLDPHTVDSLIRTSLSNHQANADVQWGIYNGERNNFLLPNRNIKVENLMQSGFKTPLYPTSLYPRPDYLSFYFPHKDHFLLKKMGIVLLSSAAFILLIVFCFSYAVYSLYRQKKLSQVKSDFINNMTHEFKTPVSTILLASEALKDPNAATDRDRYERLVNIIYDENNRIAGHVERVLQLAAMEKGNFKINKEPISLHDLIDSVVEKMKIQAEHAGGTLETRLEAQHHEVDIDIFHFSNVIRNLIDNAIKYCRTQPQILIYTFNREKEIIMGVKDNGIGLQKEQMNKIFDQFYRVSTGNVHDVKGFGLGLHYVKNIVEMHEGHIYVKSEKDSGSTFEIVLDVIQDQ